MKKQERSLQSFKWIFLNKKILSINMRFSFKREENILYKIHSILRNINEVLLVKYSQPIRSFFSENAFLFLIKCVNDDFSR
jgi:hypothetical protein